MRFFDTHCHLQSLELVSTLDGVLERADSAGVTKMLCCGTAENDWAGVAAVCNRRKAPDADTSTIIPAFGIHPWYMDGRSEKWREVLQDRLADPRAAVGEIGLDHAIEKRNDAEQEEVFLAQWDLSVQLRRPVSMHCRRAWGRLLELLPKLGRHPVGFVIHSYSGPADIVGKLVEYGAHLSFSGSITRLKNRRGHEAARAVPPDRLLVETDSPDLAPVIPGRDPDAPNEPANITFVAAKLAELRNIAVEELSETTYTNACRLFGEGNACN
ncbi:MAG: TatD family deoxyribonuclease [Verrucomicrobia bacterium]|nr:TatD family deoxyribonuclease [Verrucomicrobiota bacterium]